MYKQVLLEWTEDPCINRTIVTQCGEEDKRTELKMVNNEDFLAYYSNFSLWKELKFINHVYNYLY